MAGSQIVLTWCMAPLVAGFLSLAHCTLDNSFLDVLKSIAYSVEKCGMSRRSDFPSAVRRRFFKPLHKDR